MASDRRKKSWGLKHRQKPEADAPKGRKKEPAPDVVDHGKGADEERAKCKANFKYFYYEVLAQRIRNRRTGVEERESLGRIHDYLIDFLNLEELQTLKAADPNAVYTNLMDYLPKPDRHGDYAERWIYWPTLDSKPVVQDGAAGPIADMFYGVFWHGIIIRIKGDGMTKCILLPRGHLKSTIATQAHKLWRICRDPSERHMIQTLTLGLAKDFISYIKRHMKENKKFERLYGDMVPANRELPWNADFLTVRCDQRRGKEPTFRAAALHSETTGGHTDEITLDDIVGKTNFKTAILRDNTRKMVEQLQGIRDPGTMMVDIGTRWEEDDAHSVFTAKESPMAEDTSFMVATLLDADEKCPVPKTLTPLGYGKPIYSEKFTPRAVQRLRHGIKDDRLYYGQFFNQFTGTGARYFSQTWKENYEGSPITAAKDHKLNVFIGIDTASGKEQQQKGDLDYTAALVLGQTPDRINYYVLGGFCERMEAQEICKSIIDLGLEWKRICESYAGTFKVGVEENAYTNFLQTSLNYEKKSRTPQVTFEVYPMKTDQRAKSERIRVLSHPYSMHSIFWPKELVVPAHTKNGEPYDLIAILFEQWSKYGAAGLPHEDLLDAHGRAFELAFPQISKATPEEKKPEMPIDQYVRKAVEDWIGSGAGQLSGVDRWAGASKAPGR
jgi:hypothetical protein